MRKPKVHLKTQREETETKTANLSGIRLISFLLEDFFKVSFGVLMIYVDLVLLAYPFTFLKQYETAGTIIEILYNLHSEYSAEIIPTLLFTEIILVVLEMKLYKIIWPKNGRKFFYK